MKRIGIFDSSPNASGISRYVRALLSGVDRDEFDVSVFAQNAELYRDCDWIDVVDLSSREDVVAEATTPLHSSARGRWRNYSPRALNLLAGFGRGAVRLSRTLRAHPVDLLHVQLVGADESVVAAKLAGVPKVLGTLHIDSSQSGAARWLVETMTNHCLDRAIAVSQSTADDWIARTGLPKRCVKTIANGVDLDHFTRRRTRLEARRLLGLELGDAIVVAAVARLSEQKGLQYLIDAMARLRSTVPQIALAIAGDGPLRCTLTAQVNRLGLESCVHFIGAVDDVRPVLEAADIFALPSLWEAMPYALLEAMAMGLPSVATRVAGVPEVIVHEKSGLLVPPRDVNALVEAIARLAATSGLRDQLSDAARDRIAARFDQRDMIERTLDVYRAMLEHRASPRRRLLNAGPKWSTA